MAGLVFSVILRDEHKQYFKVDAPFVMRKMWFWGDKGKKIQRVSAGGGSHRHLPVLLYFVTYICNKGKAKFHLEVSENKDRIFPHPSL